MSATTSAGDIAREFFHKVWQEHDASAVRRLVAPDCQGYHESGVRTCGPEDFLEFQTMFRSAIPDMQIKILDLIHQDDKAAIRWEGHGIHSGSGLGLRPTHKSVTVTGMSWIRVENGQIVEGWDSWNQGDFIASLAGLKPQAAPMAPLQTNLAAAK